MYKGRILTLVDWGESHGCCIGGVLLGLPPGIPVDVDKVNRELARRRPGGRLASPRREEDRVEILSGVYRGYTTGAPLAFIIANKDVKSKFYEEVVKYKPRPGHSDAPARLYSQGFYDYRGGGHYSGRLTAVTVAAGALVEPILDVAGVETTAYLASLGGVECRVDGWVPREKVYSSTLYCPDPEASQAMEEELEDVRRRGDSLGGSVEALARGAPTGLGSPVYRIDGALAQAVMAVPGVRGVEVGAGARLASMRGSESNDPIRVREGQIVSDGPMMGGLLGGHAAGVIRLRATLKPTSTIGVEQDTVEWRSLEEARIRGWGRHDPAIAVRAVPVVEAVVRIVLADYLLEWTGRMMHYYRLERGQNK